jgi:predicted nucleotidyltransferase
MNTPESDIDYVGAFVAPINFYMGFDTKDTIQSNIASNDLVVYEVRKLIKLFMGGNPNALEILWTDPKHFLHNTDIFNELIKNRQMFVSKKIYQTFSGYASGQLKRMVSCTREVVEEFDELEELLISQGIDIKELNPRQSVRDLFVNGKKLDTYLQRYITIKKTHFAGNGRLGQKRKQLIKKYSFDVKNASVLIMLLKQSIEFLETGNLVVDRSMDKAELLSIKNGEKSLEEVKIIVDSLFDKAKAAVLVSKLPDDVDRDKIEALCVKLISDFYWIKVPQV